jgi:hypothetical protein
MVPGAFGVAFPVVTAPGTAIGDGAGTRLDEDGLRLGFDDVFWASAVPQPNKTTARRLRRKRFIQASCAHVEICVPSFRRPADLDGWSPRIDVCYF